MGQLKCLCIDLFGRADLDSDLYKGFGVLQPIMPVVVRGCFLDISTPFKFVLVEVEFISL